jgi:hypothetical protein
VLNAVLVTLMRRSLNSRRYNFRSNNAPSIHIKATCSLHRGKGTGNSNSKHQQQCPGLMSLILIRGSALTTTLLIHVKTTLERGGLSKTLLQSTNASKPCSGMVPTLKWALILIPFPWCSEYDPRKSFRAGLWVGLREGCLSGVFMPRVPDRRPKILSVTEGNPLGER